MNSAWVDPERGADMRHFGWAKGMAKRPAPGWAPGWASGLASALAVAAMLAWSPALPADRNESGGIDPGGGDELCGTRAEILDHLGGKYRERPVATGMALNGGYVELLSSGAGATWTIVITKPDGTTCVVVAGEDWEALPEVVRSSKS